MFIFSLPLLGPSVDSHPVMFLHQWYGPNIDIDFRIDNPEFRPLTYICTITVQELSFEGQGPSKKEGKNFNIFSARSLLYIVAAKIAAGKYSPHTLKRPVISD